MEFKLISINGQIVPKSEAKIDALSIESLYSFGVYETVKLRHGQIYFLDKHIDRIFHSASQINLQHDLNVENLNDYVIEFVRVLDIDSCNLKLLLLGGKNGEEPTFVIVPSAPHYPDRTWYRDGVSMMSFVYERWMPQAKTLNMLPSYFYYKKAKSTGCYDCLYLDRSRNVLEGSRTNFYLIKGKQIISPPKEVVLEGVTMLSLEKVLAKTDYRIEYKTITYSELLNYDSAFISSTSTKILPVKSIDQKIIFNISTELKNLIDIYESALDKSTGKFENL